MKILIKLKQMLKACSGKAESTIPDFSSIASSPFGALIKKYDFC